MKTLNADTEELLHVRLWTAKRSGKNMTITGRDARTDEPVKLVDIARIDADPAGGILARIAGRTDCHTLLPS